MGFVPPFKLLYAGGFGLKVILLAVILLAVILLVEIGTGATASDDGCTCNVFNLVGDALIVFTFIDVNFIGVIFSSSGNSVEICK